MDSYPAHHYLDWFPCRSVAAEYGSFVRLCDERLGKTPKSIVLASPMALVTALTVFVLVNLALGGNAAIGYLA